MPSMPRPPSTETVSCSVEREMLKGHDIKQGQAEIQEENAFHDQNANLWGVKTTTKPKLTETHQNQQTPNQNQPKPTKTNQNQPKPTKTNQNQPKPMARLVAHHGGISFPRFGLRCGRYAPQGQGTSLTGGWLQSLETFTLRISASKAKESLDWFQSSVAPIDPCLKYWVMVLF